MVRSHRVQQCSYAILTHYYNNDSDLMLVDSRAFRPTGRMEIPMKFLKAAYVAGLLAIGVTGIVSQLQATPLTNAVREGQGVTTELGGNASAITYWANEADGWHVVTTVDTVTGQNSEAEEHAVVRFTSVLLPGQSQLISVPFAVGEQQQVLRIRRIGDRIEIERLPDA